MKNKTKLLIRFYRLLGSSVGLLMLCMGTSPLYAQPTFAWAAHFGSISSDHGIDVRVDGGGNVLVSGYYSGTADFDPGPGTYSLVSNSGTDAFVVKLDPWGHFLWANSVGGTQSQMGHIALDPAGNVYLTGRFAGTIDVDPGPGQVLLTATGFIDAFVLKWDANGAFVWAKSLGGSSQFDAMSISVDGNGNVISSGTFIGTGDFDPGAGTYNLTSAGGKDIYVSKLDGSGNFIWARAFGGAGEDLVEKLAADAVGDVWTIGTFVGTADLDPGAGTLAVNSTGARDLFVQKLNSAGNLVFGFSIGGTDHETAEGIAFDGLGNAYVSGSFTYTANFDPLGTATQLTVVNWSDAFVAKYNPSGHLAWVRQWGGSINESVNAVAWDAPSGNIVCAGTYGNTFDLDPGNSTSNITAAGNGDIFIVSLTASGNYAWGTGVGGANNDLPEDLFVNNQGSVYVTGNFIGTADFDPTNDIFPLTAFGGNDAFVMKLSNCQVTGSDLAATTCDSFVAPDGQVYHATGNYTAVIPNTTGCDSVIRLSLTVQPLQATIVNAQPVLTAMPAGAQYQWLDCDIGFSVIPGATQQNFIPSQSGNYAVWITQDSCTDTSACASVTVVALNPSRDHLLAVSPNPCLGKVSVVLLERGLITLFQVDGSPVMEMESGPAPLELDLSHLAPGVYHLRFESGSTIAWRRIVLLR